MPYGGIKPASVSHGPASDVPGGRIRGTAQRCRALLIQRVAAAHRAEGLEAPIRIELHANSRSEVQTGEVAGQQRSASHLALRVCQHMDLARNCDRANAP